MKITLLLIACLIGIAYSQTSCTSRNDCDMYASICNGLTIHCVDQHCRCGSSTGGGVGGSCHNHDDCNVNGSENCDLVPNGRWKCDHDTCVCIRH